MSLEQKLTWKDVKKTGIDPLEFCNEAYKDVTRGKLSNIDRPLFDHLKRKGLHLKLPLKSEIYGDIYEYYLKHCNGLTRGPLWESYPKVYYLLKKQGKLDKVPLKKSYNDTYQEYLQHHSNESKGQLSRANPRLYYQMKKDGNIDKVPTIKEINKRKILKEYQEKFEDTTRTKLYHEHYKFYIKMMNHGLLDYVPKE